MLYDILAKEHGLMGCLVSGFVWVAGSMDRGIEETKEMKIVGSKNEAKREPNIPQMGPKSSPGFPNWSKMTTRGSQMTPRGRFGDQLGSGSEPSRALGGLRELPGAQKVDFGAHLGDPKGPKSYQNDVKS